MAKVMKFERKAARQERKENPSPGIASKPVAEKITIAARVPNNAAPIKPLEQIAGYVKSMDIPRLKAMAQRASSAGSSDDEIQNAIDAALPDGSRMPLHHLAAIAALASDQKRPSYFPLFEQHLAGDDSGQLKEFLDSLGTEN